VKKQFETFLREKGYSQKTPSGAPSTVYDYSKRVGRVCKWENMTWMELADNISTILVLYGVGGIKEDKGKLSHSAVINALKRFSEFLGKKL
jgi:hypothetical protein